MRACLSVTAAAFVLAAAAEPSAAVSPSQGLGSLEGTSQPATGAHGLRLPATFRGDLPCADCEAIRHHLDLWPDRVFHLRREWLGRDLVRDEVGRWRVDPAGRALLLHGGAEAPLQLEIQGPDELRLLDLRGRPIESALPYALVSDGTITPTELSLLLGGEVRYLADAARFTECLTGRSYPIAQEADFPSLQRAYREAVLEPGARLYVSFEGAIAPRPRMEGEGLEPTVIVERFIRAWSGQRCERAIADASLVNTYWRLVRLGDAPLEAAPGRREPHLLLRDDGGRKSYVATAGCNPLSGEYSVDGETVRFSPGVTTRMACPAPLEALERALGQALAGARRWRIHAHTLELLKESGDVLALFEAVYL